MKTWGDNVSSKHLFSNCKVLTGVGLLVNSTEAGATFFFYKNNFIRTKILILAKKKLKTIQDYSCQIIAITTKICPHV